MSKSIIRRHQDIRRMRESYTREGRQDEFVDYMVDIMHDRRVSLTDFRVRPLFEALVDDGYELVQNHFGSDHEGGYRILEAADNVNTGMFANIMGQYLFSAVLRAYEMPELIGDQLVTVTPTSLLSGERIPGLGEIGDVIEIVKEGDPYPQAVFGENWIETPDTIKRGIIVDVTKEIVFGDKTGQVLQRASNVGKWIAINREKRILDVVCGISTVYKRNGGAAEATYQSENTKTSTALVDWTSVDAVDTMYSGITDPDTGEPIVSSPNTMLVPPALKNTANRIVNATMTGQTTSARETRVDGNSLNGANFSVLSNQYVKNRTSSDSTWFYGNFREAFVYMQNWPITVEQEGANSAVAFERDIVARYKASERGAAGVMKRLVVAKVTA